MSPADRILSGVSLILGPLLFAASTFFWNGDGTYGVTSSTLLIIGSVFWISGLNGIFDTFRDAWPRYAAWGRLAAVYGAVCGGAAFAFQAMFMEMFDVSHDASLAALAAHPIVANVIFWGGGAAFPLSLLVLGVMLIRARTAPWWLGAMLALGGALFPVARIPRMAIVAHAVDLLMLVPAAYLGMMLLRRGQARASVSRR